MKIRIEYCTARNYTPKAVSLADKILENLKTRVASLELIPSGGGVFEVFKDGEKIFSKKQQGRFPEWSEIRRSLEG